MFDALSRFCNAIRTAGLEPPYVIKPGNAWVGGDSYEAIEAGASCWNWAVYNTLAWLSGANGCGVSGTDYFADAAPPSKGYGSYPSGPDKPFSMALRPSWVSDWKNAATANEGMTIDARNNTPQGFMFFRAVKSAINPLGFSITFIPPAAGAKYFLIGF